MISDKNNRQKPHEAPDDIYQAVINDILDTIIEIDLKGKIIYLSPRCFDMFGFQPQEIIGDNVLQFIHPDDLLGVSRKVKIALKDQKHVSHEFRTKHKNGSFVHVSAKGGIIDRDGVPKIIAIVRDITEKKRAEMKLRDSEYQYRTIIESMGEPLHVIDTNLKIILTNNTLKNWVANFKIQHDIIGKEITEAFPFLPVSVIEEYRKVFETGETLITEEFTELNDKAIYTEIRKIPILSRGKVLQVVTIVKDVTDRKIAEKNLKESEKAFRNIIENTKDAIVIIDFDGKLLYVAPQLSKMLKGREINKNSGFFHYIHKDDLKKLISYYKDTLKEKTFDEKPVEFRILPKYGEYMWFSSSSKNYYDDDGNTLGFISTLKDITDKKRAEQELEKSEEKYRLITENSNDLIRVLNEKFKIEFLNEKTHQQVLGYTRDELIGDFDVKLNHPDDYPKIRRFMLELFKNKEEIHISRVRHKKGYYLWFEVKTKMFLDEKGKQKYLFISRDITERRMTELALMESEEKYRNLYKNSPNAVLLLDKNGLILDMNSSAERILGYSKSELLGKNYVKFDLVTPEQVKVIKSIYKKVLKGIKPNPIEFQIKKKNGNMVWILFQSSMIKLNNKIIVEAIAQDITDKKKAENLIIEENKRLLDLNKMK
ncbi:MAG: PAS domain-containing protein, partial [Promethearchaeota archaeon]